MPSSKNKIKKKKSKITVPETPASSTKFDTGLIPHILKAGAQEDRLTTLRLGDDIVLTTDGSGLLQTVQSATPTGCGNWSSYVSTFDEYRVLAVQLQFKPLAITGGSTATFLAPVACVIDRDSAGPLTSYTLASRYSSWSEAPGGKSWKKLISMESPEEATFVSMATTKTLGWFQLYSSGNTASTTIGRLEMLCIIQFRGLGI